MFLPLQGFCYYHIVIKRALFYRDKRSKMALNKRFFNFAASKSVANATKNS